MVLFGAAIVKLILLFFSQINQSNTYLYAHVSQSKLAWVRLMIIYITTSHRIYACSRGHILIRPIFNGFPCFRGRAFWLKHEDPIRIVTSASTQKDTKKVLNKTKDTIFIYPAQNTVKIIGLLLKQLGKNESNHWINRDYRLIFYLTELVKKVTFSDTYNREGYRFISVLRSRHFVNCGT
jgi:hypothetical protein